MDAVWVDELYIETEPAVSNGDPTWSKLCAGIESLQYSANEQNQQYFFLCGKGFANNETTGAAPSIQVSGRRKVGDAAQDFVVSKQNALGDDRKANIKYITGGKQVVCNATLTNIIPGGGNATDINAFGVTLNLNGEPTVTDVQA